MKNILWLLGILATAIASRNVSERVFALFVLSITGLIFITLVVSAENFFRSIERPPRKKLFSSENGGTMKRLFRFVAIFIFISLVWMFYKIYPIETIVFVGTVIGSEILGKFADWIKPIVWIAFLKATNNYAGDDKKSS